MKAKAFIAYAAKAVAAFLTPFIMLAVLAIAKRMGVDVPISFDDVSTYVATITAAVLQAVWVYYQKNAAKVVSTEIKTTTVEVPKDSGLTFIETIVLVVVIVLAFFGVIYFFGH